MSSKKMNQRSQIKRGKTKRSEDKMDKAMSDIKKIGIISCCLVAVLLVVGIFVNPKESYAADFLTQVPEEFKSSIRKPSNDAQQNFIRYDKDGYANYIPFNNIFFGSYTTGNGVSVLDYIYCVDGRLGLPGSENTYRKGNSVKTYFNITEDTSDQITGTADYPGLLYILENHNVLGGTEEMNYYYTQIAVWWYVDRANGFSDDVNYDIKTGQPSKIEEKDYDDKFDENKEHLFVNNLSKLDKITLKNDVNGQKIEKLVNEAVANESKYSPTTGSQDIVIDKDSVTYTMTNDYVETSIIRPTSTNPNFDTYSIQINNAVGNVEIVDENNNLLDSSSISATTGFKLRVPVSEVQNENFKANITLTAYFKDFYDAYIYNNDTNPDAQRALLGKVEKPSASTSLDLEAPSINVPDTNSTSYIVYGIGALIIIAGIVLIVMAKGPKNAKKK